MGNALGCEQNDQLSFTTAEVDFSLTTDDLKEAFLLGASHASVCMAHIFDSGLNVNSLRETMAHTPLEQPWDSEDLTLSKLVSHLQSLQLGSKKRSQDPLKLSKILHDEAVSYKQLKQLWAEHYHRGAKAALGLLIQAKGDTSSSSLLVSVSSLCNNLGWKTASFQPDLSILDISSIASMLLMIQTIQLSKMQGKENLSQEQLHEEALLLLAGAAAVGLMSGSADHSARGSLISLSDSRQKHRTSLRMVDANS